MDMFVVHGGRRLAGRVRVSGAKNAALPIMAAALVADGPTILHGVPDLVDVTTLGELLTALGVTVSRELPAAVRPVEVRLAEANSSEGNARQIPPRTIRPSKNITSTFRSAYRRMRHALCRRDAATAGSHRRAPLPGRLRTRPPDAGRHLRAGAAAGAPRARLRVAARRAATSATGRSISI